jgi:hypothetical protein
LEWLFSLLQRMPDAGVRVIAQRDGTVTDNGNGTHHVKVTVTKDGNRCPMDIDSETVAGKSGFIPQVRRQITATL